MSRLGVHLHADLTGIMEERSYNLLMLFSVVSVNYSFTGMPGSVNAKWRLAVRLHNNTRFV